MFVIFAKYRWFSNFVTAKIITRWPIIAWDQTLDSFENALLVCCLKSHSRIFRIYDLTIAKESCKTQAYMYVHQLNSKGNFMIWHETSVFSFSVVLIDKQWVLRIYLNTVPKWEYSLHWMIMGNVVLTKTLHNSHL